MRTVTLPASDETLRSFRAGEMILLSGLVATARDAAHSLMLSTGNIPFDVQNVPVFYMGPSPAPPGMVIGSSGPTTSARMEPFIPEMLRFGMKIAIGKGDMSDSTRELFQKYGAVYLAATGGAGAHASTKIKSRKVIAWDYLGPEAVSILELEDFPVFVAWDLHKGSIYTGSRSR
ncbi:MAG: fumarate hydratase C-terminal domain-containing protein [Candidatus Fermentibacteraceae bacterium]|nr:fumarate hydratase C-terminal domain-containing protein [Candidatus Fermentibacteraceae bacterium]